MFFWKLHTVPSILYDHTRAHEFSTHLTLPFRVMIMEV